MEMAIDAMSRSRPEPKDDGSAPLFVGASVLFPDMRTDSASRGEYRAGDHAEYTLLERKHPTDLFDGAVVFSTLEPCAGKHARSEGKTPCAQRLIEARVKTVWMGIQDPDPTIAGVGKKLLEDAGVLVEVFDPDLQERIRALNQEWIEQADRRAALVRAAEMNDETTPTKEVLMAAAGATWADLDLTALERYRVDAKMEVPSIRHADFKVVLSQLGWLALGEDKRTYFPTDLGVILFAKEPRRFNPSSLVKLSFEYGPDTEPDLKDYAGPLMLFPDALDAWLRKVLPTTQMTDRRVIRGNFAEVAFPWIREAVMNAVVHRDYTIANAKVTATISQDVITVTSPGRPIDSIGLGKLNGFRAPSLSVNPKIHYAFNTLGAVEERGRGMKRLQGIVNAGFPRPRYIYEDPYLTLTIPLTVEAGVAAELLVLDPETTGHLSPAELRGLAYLVSNPRATNKLYATTVGVSIPTATRHLTGFETAGFVARAGTTADRELTVTDKAKR